MAGKEVTEESRISLKPLTIWAIIVGVFTAGMVIASLYFKLENRLNLVDAHLKAIDEHTESIKNEQSKIVESLKKGE